MDRVSHLPDRLGAAAIRDASALALLLFAVLFGVTWAQLKLLDRRVEYA